ncbi:hypothetical protein AXA44_26550 [Rhodococcus sp. SC4]|nr:hypothetical protein AXA44_26550 [Rhodococcus sp. SC4]
MNDPSYTETVVAEVDGARDCLRTIDTAILSSWTSQKNTGANTTRMIAGPSNAILRPTGSDHAAADHAGELEQ